MVLSLPQFLLFLIDEKVGKKSTATDKSEQVASCSIKGTTGANLCTPNRPRPILVKRRGFARAGHNEKSQNVYPELTLK